ncbi:MAG: hypothetical protein HPY61_02375 [Methanotrichaceae archaeon]|nr:hypothetical protein [Methanotrichaceae archaeon]
MEMDVPERHAQISDANHIIRRLTPERVAYDLFGCRSQARPSLAVSSFLVERAQAFSLGCSYPAGVMY